MNNINTKQNEDFFIEMLSAQRFLYSKSKKVFIVRIIISIIIAIIIPIIVTQFSGIAIYATLFVFLYTGFDFIFLRNIESSYKTEAAKIQEHFDTELFEISWNSLIAGAKIDKETICSYSKKYKKENSTDSLYDWYPKGLKALSLINAAVVCQRTNLWWDNTLRKKLLLFLTLFLILTTVLIIILFTTHMENIFIIISSLLPMYEILIDYIRSHMDSITQNIHIKNFADNNIEKVKKNENVSKNEIRELQNEIFKHRMTSPFIPDWFYWIFKDNQDDEMNYSAEHYIKEII